MILLVLSLLGCTPAPNPITEIGNPEMTVPARTASSLPEWVDTTDTSLHRIDQVWLSATQRTRLGADCQPVEPTLMATEPIDWGADTLLSLPEAANTDCGVMLELMPAASVPEGAPASVEGASVVVVGRDRLDRPFELRTTASMTLTLTSTFDGPTPWFDTDTVLALDLLVLTAGVDIASYEPDDDGIVRISDTDSRLALNVPAALRAATDLAGDGRIDAVDLNAATGASAPPLADQDRDSLPDINEERIHGSDPQDVDSDDDALGDAEEVLQYLTDPTLEDTDEDGVSDGYEVYNGTDPLDPSSF